MKKKLPTLAQLQAAIIKPMTYYELRDKLIIDCVVRHKGRRIRAVRELGLTAPTVAAAVQRHMVDNPDFYLTHRREPDGKGYKKK